MEEVEEDIEEDIEEEVEEDMEVLPPTTPHMVVTQDQWIKSFAVILIVDSKVIMRSIASSQMRKATPMDVAIATTIGIGQVSHIRFINVQF